MVIQTGRIQNPSSCRDASVMPQGKGTQGFWFIDAAPMRCAQDGDELTGMRYRRVPGPAAIDQMTQCWDWINALDTSRDRRLIYDWAQTKIKRGLTLKQLAISNGICTRTLRREVQRICVEIARNLNRDCIPQTQPAEVDAGKTKTPFGEVSGPNTTYSNHWRAANARPIIDTDDCKKRIIHV